LLTQKKKKKKDESCSNATINEKVHQLEHTLGLLDATFYYLNIPHPTYDEKKEARHAVEALSKQWSDIGLSVTLKAHVMEQHVVPFNNKYGLGDKEESFIESGHQIGIKENRRYQGMTNFQKITEASLKARTILTHPLIMQQNQKVLQRTKRKRPDRVTESNEGGKKLKSDNIKEENEQKKSSMSITLQHS
jgi:hypothetical protein